MNTSIKSILAAATLSFAAISATTTGASATKVGFGIWVGPGGPGVVIGTPGYYGGGYYGGGYGGGNICTKGEALHKAKNMGVKNRWVQNITNNKVVVRGKKSGNQVKVTFFRHTPHCAVKSFKVI